MIVTQPMDTMRKRHFNPLWYLLIVVLALSFNRCSDECKVRNRYVYYEPVYTSMATIRSSTTTTVAREIESPGRIYFKDNFIFINEAGKGIHVIDNTVPSDPKPVRFIVIPGNYDLAIRGNILFADSYVDLVAFDISNVTQAREVGRAENVFTTYGANFYVDPMLGVITDWQKRDEITRYENECEVMMQSWGGFMEGDGRIFLSSSRSFNKTAALSPGGNTYGVAGSLARFALTGDHLFALDASALDVVNIDNPSSMRVDHSQNVAWDIETIFPYKNSLFIGSKSGMYIFDLTEPTNPKQLSMYTHMRSCDPVVVEGDYAFVTLRDGNTCAGFTNQLEVINISNLTDPKLIATYPMTNPYGLGIDNGTLFVCDGRDGLKIYDASGSNVSSLQSKLLKNYPAIKALDIIPVNNIAMMLAEDGLYQYDYSDLKDIKQISHLPIVKPAP